MIVYQSGKKDFIQATRNGDIDETILSLFKSKTNRGVSPGEKRSWSNSLQHMANVLDAQDIDDDVEVGVEVFLPQHQKRIDVAIAGYDIHGQKRIVIVELKQWESIKASKLDAMVHTFVGGKERLEVHPSYQAWSYAAFLRGFNEAVYSNDIQLSPCAFLHNYKRDGIIDSPQYDAHLNEAPLFTKGEIDHLRSFLKKYLQKGSGKQVFFDLERGRIRPSKALADAVKSIVAGNKEFVLIDDQKQVYEACLAAAKRATPSSPQVVIVEGGPGTGKSVVAVNLVAALLADKLLANYVSKNAAPRKVFVEKLGGLKKDGVPMSALFTGPDRFMEASLNQYGALVVDEAHRLTEKGGFYGNQGDHLVKDIIKAGTCSIFFIDEDQRVTWQDIGTKDEIRKFVEQRGANVEEYALSSQFRCGGSDGYLAWVDNTLRIRETANSALEDLQYDFQVFDTPEEMHRAVAQKNGNNKARVVAGYCWPWNSKKNPQDFDIEIEGYRRRWNLSDDGSLWIIAPESIEQVGCIHTCQGLEVEYVGVIIGPDLVVSSDTLITVPEARDRHDKSIKGYKRDLKIDPIAAREKADQIIRNTYRTLMTRGMKGCYLYATDPAVRNYFRTAANAVKQSSDFSDN